MNTTELRQFFEERYSEVAEYASLLTDLEGAARSGPPKLEGSAAAITAPQLRILYSGVYLQLYNLVEATVFRCVDAIVSAATLGPEWYPADLSAEVRREWVRAKARTHRDMTPEHRLDSAVALCEHLVDQLPLADLKLDVRGSGTWDDNAIAALGRRVGLRLKLARKTTTAIKRPIRDDLGALRLVKDRRNRLAHGQLSFTECSDGVTVAELVTLVDVVGAYLREAVGCFATFVDSFEFLAEARRPVGL